jgi:hypothetical protein
MPSTPRDPFDLRLSDALRSSLQKYLCDELQAGLDARSGSERETSYWWTLYEQARTRTGANAPWPNAADLTSYLASEKVDALQARLLRSIWTDPIWTVEGWGDAQDRAAFVEEFHQWKAEEEGLQAVLDKLSLLCLVETRGLLEIAEGTEMRPVRKRMLAKVLTDPLTGGMIYGEDLEPQKELDAEGELVEAGPNDIAAETVVDSYERVRTGPVYRVLPYRDSLILPAHARDKQDIWGYAKRFWKSYPLLELQAKQGVYTPEAIDKLPRHGERESDDALRRSGAEVAPQEPFASEVELWELLILLDLKAFCRAYGVPVPRQTKDGARWYLTTLHLGTNQLLRMQYDDLERSRFVPFILFPRPDRATEGFSFVGHKLITTIEEHTAWRNMAADRAAMQVQAPIKRLTGALWDPVEQPWGPSAVLDVRDMRELEPVQVPDLTPAVFTHIQMMESTAERIAGINDIAAGQTSDESRTLGEVRMATANAEIRMDVVIRRFQEAMEDVFQIRHAIWKRALAEQQDMALPSSLLGNLEGRGVSIDAYLQDGKATAALLDGAFRGKPRGSVETADPYAMRQDFVQFLQALPMVLQAFPTLALQFTSPMASLAMGRQMLRVFKVENQQAFLGAPGQAPMVNPLQQLLQGLMGGGMPGVPGPMGPGAGAPMPTAPPPSGAPLLAPGNPQAMPS